MTSQEIQKTALILIDPYNDFLSEGGKLWPLTKASIEEIGLIGNLKKLVTAARANQLQVIYAPHRQTTKSDYLNWRFLSPSHQGSKSISYLKKVAGAENSIQTLFQKREILLHRTIGPQAVLQTPISISC